MDETELDESILPTKSRTILMSLEEQKARAGIESFIEKEKIQKEYNRYKEGKNESKKQNQKREINILFSIFQFLIDCYFYFYYFYFYFSIHLSIYYTQQVKHS